ncbi:carboxypeptidase regulatory-like domain-containing protein [Candidatus Saganbacteria bacterium]|nr:carboxypeptidase regulatory-like domain-containing protein [Candidatus Saganbacteria bacterium]
MASSPLKYGLVFVSCLLVIGLGGCGSTGQVARVTVSPATATVGAQQTQQFFAAAYDSAGNALARSFTWSVTGSVGTIDATSGLFYAGTSFGSGSVSAAADNISGSSTISVANNGTLTGILSDADSNTIANLQVALTQMPTFSATSNASGQYTIFNIPAGTYEVTTQATVTYLPSTAEARIVVGSTRTANITVSPRLSFVTESINTDLATGNISTVTGSIKNNGSTLALGVTITYSFFDEVGNVSANGTQTVGSLAAGAIQAFFIAPFPIISTYSTRTRVATCTSF